MAGRYDITPLDTSTRRKLLDQYNQLSDQILSQQDIDNLLARYGAMENQGLQDAQNSAMMELSQQYSPAFEAIRARNYGLYSGGGAQRDYNNLFQQSVGQLAAQRMGLGAESAARKAAYLRALAEQRIAGRQQMGSQMFGRMLTTQKRPSFGQQLLNFGGQIAGAGIGALASNPAQAAMSFAGPVARATSQGFVDPQEVAYQEAIMPQPQYRPPPAMYNNMPQPVNPNPTYYPMRKVRY